MKLFSFILMMSGLFLTGCFFSEAPKQESVKEIKGEIFGSYFVVKYRGDLSEEKLKIELDGFFKDFNHEFSTYQPDSVISQFNSLEPNEKLEVSSRFIEMLKLSKKFYEETAGAFDPTLRPVIRAWGFGGAKNQGPPSDEVLRKAMARVGFNKVNWDESKHLVWKSLKGIELDTNAMAPGWASDLIGDLLHLHNIENYMVDISGEILVKGEKVPGSPWVIGIETPSKEYGQGVQLALRLKNLAVATSGDYRQFFDDKGQRRSHIIDPRTGRPVSHQMTSVSIIATSAAQADAWSTAIMVLGEKGIELAEKSGLKVYLLEAVKSGEFKEIVSPMMSDFIREAKL